MEELKLEYKKSLQSSYVRLQLEGVPDEKRYQYYILKRGGITGLLPCTIRYINSDSFLYFDITSMQSVASLYQKKTLDREWVRDFIWNVRRIRKEMERFLLDEGNVIWHPEHIYQDLGERVFSFLYIPYYGKDNGFSEVLEYLSEHIDYRDEKLVECVYGMYEQYRQNGEIYLQHQIYEDARVLEEPLQEVRERLTEGGVKVHAGEAAGEEADADRAAGVAAAFAEVETPERRSGMENAVRKGAEKPQARPARKGLFSFLEGARKKKTDARAAYRELNRLAMEGFAVAQDVAYNPGPEPLREEEDPGPELEPVTSPEEDPGETPEGESRTVYLEDLSEKNERTYRLYRENGMVLCVLGEEAVVLGKSMNDADVILEDISVSRMHARVFPEGEHFYVEDLNSTNGTFKNGLRLQPYEKRQLTPEDELRLGGVPLVFR